MGVAVVLKRLAQNAGERTGFAAASSANNCKMLENRSSDHQTSRYRRVLVKCSHIKGGKVCLDIDLCDVFSVCEPGFVTDARKVRHPTVELRAIAFVAHLARSTKSSTICSPLSDGLIESEEIMAITFAARVQILAIAPISARGGVGPANSSIWAAQPCTLMTRPIFCDVKTDIA